MPTPNPVAQALELLKSERATKSAEVRRLDEAIAALSRLERPAEQVAPARRDTPSVRTKVVTLMEEQDRDWSTTEVIEEYDRRGDPIKALDPTNSVRSAMAKARVKGTLVQMGTGRYKHSKWGRSDTDFGPGNNGSTQDATTATT